MDNGHQLQKIRSAKEKWKKIISYSSSMTEHTREHLVERIPPPRTDMFYSRLFTGIIIVNRESYQKIPGSTS